MRSRGVRPLTAKNRSAAARQSASCPVSWVERLALLETALPEKRPGAGLSCPAVRNLRHTRTQNRFRKLQEQVEVTLRWHDLRHFAVSLWIEQCFSIKEIMTFAGHSSIRMTMERYGHLFPSPDHQKAMAQVEARLLG
jgi:integrase